jgi:uncharacterized protein
MEFLKLAFKGKNGLGLYLIGIVLVFLFYVLGQMPFMGAVFWAKSSKEIPLKNIDEFLKTNNFSLLNISNNLGYFLMLLIFVFAGLGMYIVSRIHDKSFKDLLTSRSNFDYKRYFYGFGIWIILSIVAEGIMISISKENYYLNYDFNKFVGTLLLSLIFLPIQTGVEEIFFRGYLAQGSYLHTKSVAASFIIPTLFFALVHGSNPEVGKFGILPMATYYLGAALFLSFLTYLDDGLELAMGVHFATNIFGAVFVTFDGAVLQTNSILKMKETNPWMMTLVFFIAAGIFLALASKKYNWNFNQLAKVP